MMVVLMILLKGYGEFDGNGRMILPGGEYLLFPC